MFTPEFYHISPFYARSATISCFSEKPLKSQIFAPFSTLIARKPLIASLRAIDKKTSFFAASERPFSVPKIIFQAIIYVLEVYKDFVS